MADLVVCYSGPIVTCRGAFDTGQPRFFTGKPCKHGHISQRMVSNGQCSECLRLARHSRREKNYAAVKAWRKANPSARSEQDRRWRARHPDKAAARAARHREKNIEKIRERDRLAQARMRAINPAAQKAREERFRKKREAERAKIAGRERPKICDLCNENNGGIVFDHCHETNLFRGWLCDRCNKVLGLVKDKPLLLRQLAGYLEKANGETNVGPT